MNTNKQWTMLFVQDNESLFNSNTEAFNQLFSKVDKVSSRENALKLFEDHQYDIILSDLSVKPEEVAFLKQLKDIKTEQTIFALVLPKDTDKLYNIADLGVNAFELEPEQFDLALEEIARFDPYEEQ